MELGPMSLAPIARADSRSSSISKRSESGPSSWGAKSTASGGLLASCLSAAGRCFLPTQRMARSILSAGILDAALSVEPYGAMFRKDDPQFKAVVDKTVTDMIKSGELEKLYTQWFESPIPPKNTNLNFKMNSYTKELFKNPSDKGI